MTDKELMDAMKARLQEAQWLTVYFDGGCDKNPGGIATSGWVLYDEHDVILAEEGLVVRDGGEESTNNYAEYCGLGHALKFLKEHGWSGEYRKDLLIKADSKLVVEQVNDRWKCKVKHLKVLRNRVWDLMEEMGLVFGKNSELVHVPREQNGYADGLCRKALADYLA